MSSLVKKLIFGLSTPFLLVILTSCIRIDGNIAIEQSGLVNGNLTYAFDRQLASLAEVNTLADLQKEASTQDELKSICTNFIWTETKSEYIGTCDLKNANLKEGDLQVKVEKDSIEFSFKSNLDAEDSKSKDKESSEFQVAVLKSLTFA